MFKAGSNDWSCVSMLIYNVHYDYYYNKNHIVYLEGGKEEEEKEECLKALLST